MRRSQPAALRESRQRLIDEAVAGGPGALSNAQRAALLGDPLALSRLHFQVWSAARAHADWFGGEAPPAVAVVRTLPAAVLAQEALAAAAG